GYAAEEREHDQDHEQDRDAQRDLHVAHGSADGAGGVDDDGDLDRGGDGGLELGQQGADAVHGLDDVPARLPEDDDDDRGLAVGEAAGSDVLHGIRHA